MDFDAFVKKEKKTIFLHRYKLVIPYIQKTFKLLSQSFLDLGHSKDPSVNTIKIINKHSKKIRKLRNSFKKYEPRPLFYYFIKDKIENDSTYYDLDLLLKESLSFYKEMSKQNKKEAIKYFNKINK